MGKGTKIEWAHHTFNPWWGCTKVSPGCQHCYAETFAKRTGNKVWGDNAERRFFGDKHWAEPLKWDNDAAVAKGDHAHECMMDPTYGMHVKPPQNPRVFCASMADVFEDRHDLIEPRARLFRMIARTPNLTWLLLTKRPQNIERLSVKTLPRNVWLGTSAENQEYWDKRVPVLMRIPATVHFVSCEPLVGPIYDILDDALPEWIIVGGESGPRQIDPEWVERIQKQCEGRTKFFFKQWGGRTPSAKTAAGRELHGRTYDEVPETA